MGLKPVNRVTCAIAGSKKPRRGEGRRVEKSVHVEDREVTLPEGNVRTVRLYARGGAIGLGELTDKGELNFVELPRLRTHRNQDPSGLFRRYNQYVLPGLYGGKPLMVRPPTNHTDPPPQSPPTPNLPPPPPTRP